MSKTTKTHDTSEIVNLTADEIKKVFKVSVRGHSYFVEPVSSDLKEFEVHLNDDGVFKVENVDLSMDVCDCTFFEKRVLEDDNWVECHHVTAAKQVREEIQEEYGI